VPVHRDDDPPTPGHWPGNDERGRIRRRDGHHATSLAHARNGQVCTRSRVARPIRPKAEHQPVSSVVRRRCERHSKHSRDRSQPRTYSHAERVTGAGRRRGRERTNYATRLLCESCLSGTRSRARKHQREQDHKADEVPPKHPHLPQGTKHLRVLPSDVSRLDRPPVDCGTTLSRPLPSLRTSPHRFCGKGTRCPSGSSNYVCSTAVLP
jgi:hypothetical protein